MRGKTSKISAVLAAVAGFVMIAATAGIATATAQETGQAGVFVVSGVPVDETAASARAARELALTAGQISATEQMLARLTRKENRALLPPVDIETARTLVKSLQVENERTSDVRYLAELVVTFEPDAVRDYLRAAGVPFTEVRSRPVLVVPVLADGVNYLLWEEPNPWRAAWRDHPESYGLVPIVSPIGDLNDLTGLSAEQAVDADEGALGEAVARYGAGSAMVTIATITGDEPGAQSIEVVATRVGRFEEPPLIISLQSAAEETQELFLDRAVSAVISALDDDWKLTNTVSFEEAGTMLVAVPISGLPGWIELRRRLAEVPSVTEVLVNALTAGSAEVEIGYRGDAEQLVRALDRFDLILEPVGFRNDGPVSRSLDPLGPTSPTHVLRLADN